MNNQIIQRILALQPESLLIASMDALADELSMLFSKVRSIVIFNKNQFYLKKMGMIFKNQGIVTVSDEDQLQNRHFDCVLVNDIILNTRYLMNVDFDRVISQAMITVDVHGFTKISNNEWVKTDIMNHKSRSIVDSKVSFSGEAFCSFFTVNYNTSKLINILIQSIHKYVKSFKYDIWVFDNSDKEKLELFEEWPDVHVIDNTKGQVVNYDEELPKYCDMNLLEKCNRFMSVRHTLAIEHGLNDDRISDNFILCDSDVLITNDVSFIDDTKLCIGSSAVTMAYKNEKERLLPFLCYINKKLMKEENIKFFDPERFIYCKKCKSGYRYDTGASFLEDIKRNERRKSLIKFIDITNYCIHFGSASCGPRYLNRINIKQICKEHGLIDSKPIMHFDYSCNNEVERLKKVIREFSQYSANGNKVVIYTAVTQGYDAVSKQQFYEDEIDYVCFTDTPVKSDHWKMVDISSLYDILGIKNPQLLARFIKTHPHLFLSEYEKSIWIDGNFVIQCDDLMHKFIPMLGDEYILMKTHLKGEDYDVYGECKDCIRLKKDSSERLECIRKFLQFQGFSDKGCHVESGIMLRKHNDPECIKLMEKWWEMIRDFSIRDQMSFNYVFWKYGGKFATVSSQLMYSRFFKVVAHKK